MEDVLDSLLAQSPPKASALPRVRVALLESLPAEADAVMELLEQSNCEVTYRSRRETFVEMVKRQSFDMLILDWNKQDLAGYEVLRHVREELHLDVPVLMLSARDDDTQVAQALNSGADDYVVKPWRPLELIARIRLLLRDSHAAVNERKEEIIEGWRFHFVHKVVSHGSQSIKLPHKEFELARLLFRHMGRPLSRKDLMRAVWSEEVSSRTIDTHISRVRIRLGLTAENGFQLQAIYGLGYKLDRLDPVLRQQPGSLHVVKLSAAAA